MKRSISVSRRKASGIVIIIMALLVGSTYLITTYYLPDESPHEDDLEIEPHPYNNLNWWDIPWELASSASLVGKMNAIDQFDYRHMLTFPEGYYEAAAIIATTLEDYGLETWYEGTHRSLMALKHGYGSDNRAIVFTAYLDTELGYPYTLQYNTGSCAMLAFIAELLSNYRLPIDVYFCFPAYSRSGDYAPSGDLIPLHFGAEEISDYLLSKSLNILALYDFEGVNLANEGYYAGYDGNAAYRKATFLAQMLQVFLKQRGYDILRYGTNDFDLSDQTVYIAHGFPTIHLESVAEISPEDPPSDTLYSSDYNNEYISALGKACAAMTIFLALSGNGNDIEHLHVTEIEAQGYADIWTQMSKSQIISMHAELNTSAALDFYLLTDEDETISQVLVSGHNVSAAFDEECGIGPRLIRIRNVGNTSVKMRLIVEYENDYDGNDVTDAAQYIWPEPLPALDWDHDALSDIIEREVGTDVFIPDTDMDSMGDGYEYNFGLDPLKDDTLEDFDQDGLSNIREHGLGTFPNCTDTDMDALDDLWEVTFLTDPLIDDANNDPDNDTLTNLEEYQYGADPLSPDGDFDGIPDAQEVALGTNPLSSDSDSDGLRDQLELIEGLDPLAPDYDIDLSPDGPDRNPRINAILIIIGLAFIPVLIGTIYFARKIR